MNRLALVVALIVSLIVSPASSYSETLSGADPSGIVDSADAINACLVSAGANGTCWIGRGAYKASRNIRIPANTTLACGLSFPMRQDYNSGFTQETAIMLDPAHSIKATGDGAQLLGCLIYRLGMTFPPANAADFSGIAVTDAGHSDFSIVNSVIVGFDTCVYVTGLRPYLNRGLADCAGLAKAAVEWDVGNTDSGYLRDVRVNPLNGAGTCASLQRPGTGIRMGGNGGPGAYMDGVVVQGYQGAQYDFANGGLTEAGQIWADNPLTTCGLVPPSVGVLIQNGASIQAHQVYISAQWYGIWTISSGAESLMGFLAITNSYFGIMLGHAEGSGNIITILTSMDRISYPAIYVGHANAGYHSMRTVLKHVNNGAPPYIWSDPSVTMQIGLGSLGQFSIKSFQTDLGSQNPFQMPHFVAGPGSADTLTGITFP